MFKYAPQRLKYRIFKKLHKFKSKFIYNNKILSHPITKHIKVDNFNIKELKTEVKLSISSKIAYSGFHQYGTQWWTNPRCPFSYQYIELDAMYEDSYFEEGVGHPDYIRSKNLYLYMQETYNKLFGNNFHSILELGTGGGEITIHFHENNLDFIAVEGTLGGVNKLKRIGIPHDKIRHQNLKFLEKIDQKFDLTMCTEVAEHIEPWFASKLVEGCTSNSNAVWFSAAKGGSVPHYHHINEVPIEAWDNIFAHFGFNYYVELNGLEGRADRIYMNALAFSKVKVA